MNNDKEHVLVLSICYWIAAALNMLAACMVGGYAILIPIIMEAAAKPSQPGPPPWLGGLMTAGMLAIAVLYLVWSGLLIVAALSLAAHKRRTLCLIAAGIECINIPLGTVLGVFTFVVLSRQSVRDLFEGREPRPPLAPGMPPAPPIAPSRPA